MKRNPAIELYRCLLMFGICLLQSITMAGHNTPWAANCLMWCVPAFVFITGWFGIKFSFAKLIKLYGTSFYCAAMFVVADSLMTGQWGSMCLERIWKITIGQWFLNAYAVLMCFAPILNKAIETAKGKEVVALLAPIFLVAFGWSFAMTLPIVPQWIPNSNGLTAYSFTTLIGVYVLARALRIAGVEELGFPCWIKSAAFGVCVLVASVGFGDYNSPFAVGVAVIAFYWAKSLKCPEYIGHVVTRLGASMFSVYLIHSHGHAWGYLECFENFLLNHHVGIGAAYVATACAVFSVCCLMDMPRRIVSKLIARVFER